MRESQLDRHSGKQRLIIILCVCFSLILFSLVIGLIVGAPDTQKSAPLAAQKAQADPIVPNGLTSDVLFTGDIFLGRSVHKWSQASPLGYAYPFSGLSEFRKENYDAWVANLECPFVPGITPTETQEKAQLKFNCQPEYLPELAKWFDVVSVANNHTSNQGAQGFAATQGQLDANHIQYFGHYDPAVLDQVCSVTGLPVKVKLTNNTTVKGTLPFAFCGYHGVAKVPSSDSLAVMQKYSKYMPVIAYPHMGTEYQPSADSVRTRLYRAMIDNGADAVLASHPHWIQNTEAYRGKLIVYSMGNFIFDQTQEAETQRGAAITLHLVSESDINIDQLAAWLKLGPECTASNDSCLAKAEQAGLKRLPLSFTFGMQGVDMSGHLTKPAGTELTASIANRLSWNQTAAELQPAGKLYLSKAP